MLASSASVDIDSPGTEAKHSLLFPPKSISHGRPAAFVYVMPCLVKKFHSPYPTEPPR